MNTATKFLLAVVGVLVLALALLGWQLTRAHAAQRTAALRADSIAAANDTTRQVLANERKLLGDSLQVVQRRVIQVVQVNDALDRALGLQRTALLQLTAEVRELRATVGSTGPVTETPEGTRTASFTITGDTTKTPPEPPYTLTADVTLPKPPGAGTLTARVSLPPIRLTVRPGCGPKGPDGVRPATVSLSGPRWLVLGLPQVQQAPEVCNAVSERVSRWWSLLPHLSAGYGLTLTGSKELQAGFQLGAHYDLWRPGKRR